MRLKINSFISIKDASKLVRIAILITKAFRYFDRILINHFSRNSSLTKRKFPWIIDVDVGEEILLHLNKVQDFNDNIIFYRTDIIFQVPFYILSPISLMVLLFWCFFLKQMVLPWRLSLLQKDYTSSAILSSFYCNNLVNIGTEKWIYGLHFIIIAVQILSSFVRIFCRS